MPRSRVCKNPRSGFQPSPYMCNPLGPDGRWADLSLDFQDLVLFCSDLLRSAASMFVWPQLPRNRWSLFRSAASMFVWPPSVSPSLMETLQAIHAPAYHQIWLAGLSLIVFKFSSINMSSTTSLVSSPPSTSSTPFNALAALLPDGDNRGFRISFK